MNQSMFLVIFAPLAFTALFVLARAWVIEKRRRDAEDVQRRVNEKNATMQREIFMEQRKHYKKRGWI